jgi:hypothetical protein
MRERLGSIGRWLRHPTLTLASNIWFIVTIAIGAGTLAAGLLGGALAVLTSFPLVWLTLAALGAFLVAGSGIGLLLQRTLAIRATAPTPQLPVDPHEVERRQELRRSIGRMLAELEVTKGVLERPQGILPMFPTLRTSEWDSHSDRLSIEGLVGAHRAARSAYRHISEFNDSVYSGPSQVRDTLRAVQAAIDELDAAANAVP